MTATSPITTHVLDISLGRPAGGIAVRLERASGDDAWQRLGESTTNAEGRITDLLPAGPLPAGRYRLVFAVDKYFRHLNVVGFYPQITVEFQTTAAAEHYHVPLLLSPFGYSTYRGS